MALFDEIRLGSSAAGDFEVERSLRFNKTGGQNHYLVRTPSSAGNRRTFTLSTWVKLSNLGTTRTFFKGGTNDQDNFLVRFDAGNQLKVFNNASNSPNLNHNLFKGVSIFEFIKPRARKINEISNDQILKSLPFKSG